MQMQTRYRVEEHRMALESLAYDLALALDHTLALDHDRVHGHVHDLDHDRIGPYHDRDPALDHDLCRDLDSLDLDHDLDHDRIDLDLCLDPLMTLLET